MKPNVGTTTVSGEGIYEVDGVRREGYFETDGDGNDIFSYTDEFGDSYTILIEE